MRILAREVVSLLHLLSNRATVEVHMVLCGQVGARKAKDRIRTSQAQLNSVGMQLGEQLGVCSEHLNANVVESDAIVCLRLCRHGQSEQSVCSEH